LPVLHGQIALFLSIKHHDIVIIVAIFLHVALRGVVVFVLIILPFLLVRSAACRGLSPARAGCLASLK
jgi:hypothetical protein